MKRVIAGASAAIVVLGGAGVLPAATAAPAPAGARTALPVVGPGSEIGVVQERRANGRVRTKTCTVGFVAERPDGRRVAVTAGHCGSRGQQVGAPIPGERGALQKVGTVTQSSSPRTMKDPETGEQVLVNPQEADWAVIDLHPRIPTTSSRGPVRQTRVGVARVGERVCQQGVTLGWRCGTVLAVTPTQILADITSRPGDSGGPLVRLSDGAALGITTAGTDDDVKPGEQATIYWSVRDVFARGGGLRLATTNRGGVPAPNRAAAGDEERTFLAASETVALPVGAGI
ncbi:S1 family peptidase [Tsukamurella sp. 1534]|uniref:S1 family peptidase n=1 Tax=Tsukamurella sp. 1534 TaxID=1151061 RepID=UPI00030EA03C|nr:S1 family peptidase [Tsukamurella sp. 1534]